MTSTVSTSTIVATGKDTKTKPKVPALQTPVSASYPSEIRSPLPGTPAYLIKEEYIKTPITPPNAYLDFLKTMSPALMSPAPTGTNPYFIFPGRTGDGATDEVDEKTTQRPHVSEIKPSLSRSSSSDSAGTVVTVATEGSDASDETSDSNQVRTSVECKKEDVSSDAIDSKVLPSRSNSKSKPQSPRIIIPRSSTFAKPASARLTRRGQYAGSPLSPSNVQTPMSARSHHEPRSASCLSATPWSASFSPSSSEADGSSSNNKSGKVCVRQVVTRTVTYSQTALDPAPKGKRRKLEE